MSSWNTKGNVALKEMVDSDLAGFERASIIHLEAVINQAYALIRLLPGQEENALIELEAIFRRSQQGEFKIGDIKDVYQISLNAVVKYFQNYKQHRDILQKHGLSMLRPIVKSDQDLIASLEAVAEAVSAAKTEIHDLHRKNPEKPRPLCKNHPLSARFRPVAMGRTQTSRVRCR